MSNFKQRSVFNRSWGFNINYDRKLIKLRLVSVRKIPTFHRSQYAEEISSCCSPPQPGALRPVAPLRTTTGTHDDGVTPLVPQFSWSVKRIVRQSSNITVFIITVNNHLYNYVYYIYIFSLFAHSSAWITATGRVSVCGLKYVTQSLVVQAIVTYWPVNNL